MTAKAETAWLLERCPRMAARGLALVALVAATLPVAALDPATRFRDYALQHWRVEHGLPQISVQALAQDRHGYLWIGTQGGVARFDGLRFTVFDRARGGVDTTFATAAMVDARDRVWFGTPRGAVVIEGGAVRELRVAGARLSVRSIALDAEGAPLFGTERGILRAEGDALVPHLLPGTPIRSMVRDAEALWVGTDGALLRLASGTTERFALPGNGRQARHLALAGTALLVGTEAGVLRFDPGQRAFAGPLAGTDDETIEALLVDRSGNLWVGAATALLKLAPDGRIERIADDVFAARPWVNALLEDRDGNLWIGTRRESLYRATDSALRMRSVQDGLDDQMVWSVLADGDGVLVGSNSGLNRLDASGRIAPVALRGRLPQPTVYDLARDRDGALWIGTRAGLAVAERGALTTPPALAPLLGKQITGVVEVAPDDHWIATLAGLYRLRGDALETVIADQGAAVNLIRCLLLRGPDELWVGTQDGVRVVRGGQVTRPAWAAPFDGAFVSRLVAMPDGRVLVATMESGIGVLAGSSLIVMDAAMGLPTTGAITMDFVGDHLYVASLEGLWRIPRAGLPDPTQAAPTRVPAEVIAGSDIRDLSIRGFACCNGGAQARSARVGQYLFYPTTEGVVRLDTAAFRAPRVQPAATVESIVHAGQARLGGAPFAIEGVDRDLSIDYSAVTFVRAYALEFRYRLEGYDAEWVEAGERRTAYYTHLPHGEFRFVVQARSPNGEWGAESAGLAITVAPLWHERTVVRLGALLAALLLLALTWRGRMAQVRAREAALEAAVAERTRDLARANERLRVANQTLALENQTDPLTGLYNRRFILSNALRGGAARATDRSAVLVIQLDEFKWINEAHGFASGDRVLVELGDLLSRSVRGGDVVARWSGVEFLLLLPGLDESGALELAERTRARIAAHEFRTADESPLRLTASVGFAHHAPDEAGDGSIEQTLDLADAAMQRAKRQGRNRVAGLRRLGRGLPPRVPASDIESLVSAGSLVWIEMSSDG